MTYFPPPISPSPTPEDAKNAPSAIERLAISLIDSERVAWETTVSFVTDRVAFNMKNLIRQLRKNWWGVFDEPIDPQTGRKKIWVPLTESVGETVVKNIDLDTKDVNFRAKKPQAVKLTALVRSIVRNFLEKMRFGEKLDELETILARDGTCVWKTIEKKVKDKFITDIRIVDLLNVYLDPTSPSIQEAYRFTERSVMYPDEVSKMKGWINTQGITGTVSLPRNDGFFRNAANTLGTVKTIDVWESWGKFPKYLLTGKSEDMTMDEDIHIIISGLEAGKCRVHLIESYDGKKPYEEAWYAKVPGRWYGKGIAEKLLFLQLWINEIVNIRLTKNRISQLGILTIRRGSGITPQMLTRLPATGAITVNSQDDIRQLAMEEASVSSYKDEDTVYGWSQRVTSAFESVTGEQLPSETSATATALQTHSAQSQFVLVKEQIGMFLQRWLKDHAMPTIFKNVKKGDLVGMALEDDELLAWDEMFVHQALYQELDRILQTGALILPEQVELEKQRLMEKMKGVGKERFVEVLHDLDVTQYDVDVDITNESVDKGVITQNLIQALTAAPEYRDSILPQLFDMMGLTFQKPQTPPQPIAQNGQPAGQGMNPKAPQTQSPVLVLGRANTLATQGEANG